MKLSKVMYSTNEAFKIMLEWLNEDHSQLESWFESSFSSEDLETSIMEEISSPLIIKGDETSSTEAPPLNKR